MEGSVGRRFYPILGDMEYFLKEAYKHCDLRTGTLCLQIRYLVAGEDEINGRKQGFDGGKHHFESFHLAHGKGK
jgi:hypothetical protein